jgi:hypothetical protein
VRQQSVDVYSGVGVKSSGRSGGWKSSRAQENGWDGSGSSLARSYARMAMVVRAANDTLV